MATDPLVGVWRLISWENRSSDGAVSYPLGQDALGYIMYNHDGYMFVAIARRDRAKFAAGDLLRASTQEKAHAAETYISYCGRYDFYGDTVVHHVDLSLFPNWVDVDQERQVEVSGDRMTLSTRPMLLGGVQRRAHLIWERA
jgi:Lipocalin-like domain